MSPLRFWLTMAGWAVFLIAGLTWMWYQVRKADKRADQEEARAIEADAAWDEWCEEMAIKNSEKRKATQLGFRDGPFALDEDQQPHLPKAS